jgi:hypothetical protein
MSRILVVTASAILLVNHAWGYPGRIWFSLSGVDEGQAIDGTPAEYYAQANPQVDASAATVRLYIWGSLGAYDVYRAASLDVNVYAQAGSVALVGSDIYNFNSPDYPTLWRWDYIEQGSLTEHKLDNGLMLAINGWGWSYVAGDCGDVQYDPQTLSMLLGYVDLEMSPDAQAQIFFGVGGWGFASDNDPGYTMIYFGWGDPAIRGDEPPYGQETQFADAVIVPEPATLLLALSPLALMRRRQRRPGRRASGTKFAALFHGRH